MKAAEKLQPTEEPQKRKNTPDERILDLLAQIKQLKIEAEEKDRLIERQAHKLKMRKTELKRLNNANVQKLYLLLQREKKIEELNNKA